MHSLLADNIAPWRIQDQGELTDVLTTHPYPIFTPHCSRDPLNTIRTCLHSVAESRLYADVGNRPCLVEEFGTLGPTMASDDVAADYTRTCLFANWAQDNRGLMWWCAHDQAHLPQTPYDWQALECELGLLRNDYTPKPVAREIKSFATFLDSLPFETLPSVQREALCILSYDQDTWASAYSSFILATQAGLTLEYQYVDQPLKDSSLYLLPNATGSLAIPKRRWTALLEKVHAGATLYISSQGVMLSRFEEVTGLRLVTRRQSSAETVRFEGIAGLESLNVTTPVRFHVESMGAEVLGRFSNGDIAFSRHTYGRGEVYFLAVPFEQHLAETPGLFPAPETYPAWRVYEHIGRSQLAKHVARKDNPQAVLTEHALDDTHCVLVLVNFSPVPVTTKLALQTNWSIETVLHGQPLMGDVCSIPANDAAVIVVRKR